MHRSAYRYKAKARDAWMRRLRASVKQYSLSHRRWDYPGTTKLPRDDGWEVGKRGVRRIRRELGVRVPMRNPKGALWGSLKGFQRRPAHRGDV